jgi:hypothetical protein
MGYIYDGLDDDRKVNSGERIDLKDQLAERRLAPRAPKLGVAHHCGRVIGFGNEGLALVTHFCPILRMAGGL